MMVADSPVLLEEEEEEEEQFFDSTMLIDSSPGSPSGYVSCPEENFDDLASNYAIWIKSPESVLDRRHNFKRLMGLDQINSSGSESVDLDDEITVDSVVASSIGGIASDAGSMLGTSGFDYGSSTSSWSSEGATTSEDSSSEDPISYKTKNFDDDSASSLCQFSSNEMIRADSTERRSRPFAFVQQLIRREDSDRCSSSNSEKSMGKIGWLRRLGAVACIVDRQRDEIGSTPCDSDVSEGSKVRRVRVRPYRKTSKEFSAVFTGQDIKAHDGAILTMKFSPDGHYLASGGEDGVVRVWRVMTSERKDDDELPEDDPSCSYFTVNRNSELAPLYAEKEKKAKRRNSDSACVVVPSDVFRIHEKPLHEFHGHHGDVLDLSWSNDKRLLSSSTDKTARLWRVGCNRCLKVFPHYNYVTCVQFNPVNDNYFISGSIDGKVRMWGIKKCRVLDWIDVREIVTAVCYRPDGKGGVVGTITGDCRFFDASDKYLQLEAQVSLQEKKKSHNKRITGIQFCPTDHRKLMVTSADSKVRILDGADVIGKYKGLRNTGGQISASFTSDGRHIVSASEDSNVYVWATSHQTKSTWSSERFFSSNASVAIPWNSQCSQNPLIRDETGISRKDSNLHAPSQEFSPGFSAKRTATWPEERLPSSSDAMALLSKPDYMFLKASCRNASGAWGRVIVTAGFDGRIRSFQNYGLPLNL